MRRTVLFLVTICFCLASVFDVGAQQRKKQRRAAGRPWIESFTVKNGRVIWQLRDPRGRVVRTKIVPLRGNSASEPDEQEPRRAQRTSRSQAKQGRAMAEIIVENANLREAPNASSAVIREVALGEKLALGNSRRVGPWYQVVDEETGREGWLHGNTFKIVPIKGKPVNNDEAAESGSSAVGIIGGRVKSVNSKKIVLEQGDETQSFVITKRTKICVDGRRVDSWRELIGAEMVNIVTDGESNVALEIYNGGLFRCLR
jgi:hypothetical protein